MANVPFIEERLSPKITLGGKGGPAFNTRVATTGSGFSSVNRMWLYPLHRFDVTQAIRSKERFEEVRALFYICEGRATGFRYKDWADFEATQANSTLLVTDAGPWQLVRLYRHGSYTYLRPIAKPLGGTVDVFRTRSGTTIEIEPTIDFETGLVTITGHVAGDTYAWEGEFDVPVWFVSDVMEAVIDNKSKKLGLMISWPDIQLEERRLRNG